MIFTHPLNLEVKSLLVHTDREREAYYLNPQKSDKSVQLLQGGWNWDGVVRFPNPLVFGSQSQSQAGTLSRMGGQCLLVATEKIQMLEQTSLTWGPLPSVIQLTRDPFFHWAGLPILATLIF